ncbi:WD40/YVTN/BNR-like repeat-containing protein [Pokkaliibacter sp. CJK22405]|uniref:WD40/YVTN/BNR-like repeat-containing protein n=1 Tax=Pokkaliibacter sp. CJK22405 TaxID=3384615 RepID=UPI0039846345
MSSKAVAEAYRRHHRMWQWSLTLFLIVIMNMARAAEITPVGSADLREYPALALRHPEHTLQVDLARAGKRIVSVGERGIVIYSDNEGVSWHQAEVPVSVMLTAVTFISPEEGWAVGHGGVVLHSTDRGEHWQKVLDGNRLAKLTIEDWQQHLEALNNSIDVDESAIETAEYALEDAKANATSAAGNPLLDVFFSSPENGWLLGAYGQLFETRDGGANWHSIASRTENPDNLHLNAMTELADGELLIAGEAGLLLRAGGEGQDFVAETDSPYEGSYFGVFRSAQRVYLLGLRGNVFAGDSAGHGWQPVSLSDSQSVAAAAESSGEVVMIGNGGFWAQGKESALNALTVETLPERAAHSAILPLDSGWLIAGNDGLTRIPASGPESASAMNLSAQTNKEGAQ